MKTASKITVAALVLMIGTGMAAAQEKYEKTQSKESGTKLTREGMIWVTESTLYTPAGRSLHVHSDVGSVQVRGGATNGKVTCVVKLRVARTTEEQARKEIAKFNTSIFHKGEMVYFSGDFPNEHSVRLVPDITITLPRETDLVYIETLGGTVSVYGITGKVELSTAGGGIVAEDVGGMVRAHTLGGSIGVNKGGGDAFLETTGSISVGTLKGTLTATTHGGSVDVQNVSGNVNIESGAGPINVQHCGGNLVANTAGGTIQIGDVAGKANLSSAGGSIRLASAGGRVRAETAGGSIQLYRLSQGAQASTNTGTIEAEFVANPAAFSDSRFETSMGDIWVALPSDLKVTVKAEVELANGHKITSDFIGIRVIRDNPGSGPTTLYADGSLNGGGPVLKVVTTGGNITLSKKK